jgi:hypothetical protein
VHRGVTALSRPCNTAGATCRRRIVVTCGRSRASAGSARTPTTLIWRQGRERKARCASSTGWHAEGRVASRMPPLGVAGRERRGCRQSACFLEGTGPLGRASADCGGWPATIGAEAATRVKPEVLGREKRVDGLSRACYSDTPVGTTPQGPPAAEGDSPASSGAVLWHTRHQHRLDWCVPGRSLKTE